LTTKSGKVKLSIEDDGVGLPTDLVLKRKKNLGLQIIETLTQQLRGEHHFKSNENGTQFTLLFDKNIKIQEPLKESAL
jgi:two-component sensor histidine kinase